MTITARAYAGVIVFTIILIVVVVLGNRGGAFSRDDSSLLASPSPTSSEVNRIAYVSPDGQIHSINPDGTDSRQISEGNGFFTWPTWSPDGENLLYSGVLDRGSNDPQISLFVNNLSNGDSHETFAGEPGVAGLLAQGVVHYPLWSPNGKHLAFIAVTSRGLTLLIDDLEDDPSAEFVLDIGPLWMSWSPDSERLLVHRGNEHFLVTVGDTISVANLQLGTDGYRVPAWEPTGTDATLVFGNRVLGYSIIQARLDSGDLVHGETFRRFSTAPVFLWSPDGERLASASSGPLLTFQGLTLPVYQDLRVTSKSGASQPIGILDNVLAYFWSPDGNKLAYVTFSPDARGVVTWRVLNTESGAVRALTEFTPSLDQLTTFQFFDQYAYSHSPWSPDSESLVFSGNLGRSSIPASFGRQSASTNILTVGTSENANVRILAEGILGFWSPR